MTPPFMRRAQTVRAIEYLVLLFLPFYMMFWINPLVSDLSIGEDYQRFPIDIQMELLFSIETGTFPLYLPGALGGLPASSGILGQLYHPISHISRLMPGYWDGSAMACNTVFRLMTFGWAHLALYVFLRRLRTGRLMAFLLSMATVYNLRTMELFLYGASVETWTGFLFLIAAIGCFDPDRGRWRGALPIIGATYWLVSSGHPQMTYHALTGVVLFTLTLPFLIRHIDPDRRITHRKCLGFWMWTTCFCVLGVILAAASWLPFYFEFVKVNAGRVGQPYEWAVMYNDTLVGTLNNFFLPLRSGSGAFGGLPLFLMALLVPVLVLFRVKIPGIVWIIWGMTVFVILYMLGPLTPVHYVCWKYVPLVSSFRMAGRISIVMPVLLLLILIWAAHAPSARMRVLNRYRRISPLALLAVSALVFMGLYAPAAGRLFPLMSEYAIRHLVEAPWETEWPAFFWSLILLSGLLVHQAVPRLKFMTAIVVCLPAIFQLMILIRCGTWMEPRQIKPTFARIQEHKREALHFRPQPGTGGISRDVVRHLERFFLEPDLARIHHEVITARDNDTAYALLGDAYRKGALVIEASFPASRIPEVPAEPPALTLVHSSYNRLVFQTETRSKGFLLLAMPFAAEWKAEIDGKPVEVHRANGYAMAVPLGPGTQRVEFAYHSVWARVGVLVSLAAFAGIFGFFSLKSLPSPWNRCLAAAAVLISGGVFFVWNSSLYHGRNLETVYSWTPRPPNPNLAFARDTRMSGRWSEYPELFNSPLAVNGVSKPMDAFFSAGSGFITDLQSEPWWDVDLGAVESVETIRLHESEYRGLEWNRRPIRIRFSADGAVWNTEFVNDARNEAPVEVRFAEPVRFRYLRIQASGFCRLSLSEVEVLPPSSMSRK